MSFSVNPGTFQSMEIETTHEQKFFLRQLSDLLTQITKQITVVQGQIGVLQSASGLAAILNGSGTLNYSALNVSANNFGSVSTSQTVNCNSAAIVSVHIAFTAAITLTLNNLGTGVPVAISTNSSGAFTFKMAATLPGGTAYTVINQFNAGTVTSMITTGWTPAGAASRIFIGITNTPSILQLAYV